MIKLNYLLHIFSILNYSCYVTKKYLTYLLLFSLSQDALTSWMMAVTLEKLLKAYFHFSIVAKCRGILNNSCYVTKWLEASLPFSIAAKWCDLLSKNIIWFWTQGAFFPNLFSFKTQWCESSRKVMIGVRN